MILNEPVKALGVAMESPVTARIDLEEESYPSTTTQLPLATRFMEHDITHHEEAHLGPLADEVIIPTIMSKSVCLRHNGSLCTCAPVPSGPLQRLQARPQPPRRAMSEGTPYLKHKASMVSSLGDGSRFEKVEGQVNSRFKAFKDTLADSNIKLPRISSLQNVTLPSVRLSELSNSKGATETSPSLKRPGISGAKSLVGSLVKTSSSVGFSIHKGPPSSPLKNKSLGKSFVNTEEWPTALNEIVDEMEGDVVFLGGYRGSVLRSAEPPHRQLWIPAKVGLNLRRVNLEVGLNQEDETNMEKHIIPSGMLTRIGPIDISHRLIKTLQRSKPARNGRLRIWNYGYDWRLSPHLLSGKLIDFLKTLPANSLHTPAEQRGATVIAHSLGGLITRHAVNHFPGLFSGVVYAGVPIDCVGVLGPLRHGDEVLLSSKVLSATVNFTMRTSFLLLPEDGRCFIDQSTREPLPVDFFNIRSWYEHRFSPCIASPLCSIPQSNSGLESLIGYAPTTKTRSATSTMRRFFLSSPKLKAFLSDSNNSSEDHLDTPGSASSPETQSTVSRVSSNSHGLTPQLHGKLAAENISGEGAEALPGTASFSFKDAKEYLQRTLAETMRFKRELRFKQDYAEGNLYPPAAVLYGKSVATVSGAIVDGTGSIKRDDAYDNPTFASGDGVCLARAAMLPEGYSIVQGGRVSSSRGHLTLLGDLNGVARCLKAIVEGRKRGIGRGRMDEE